MTKRKLFYLISTVGLIVLATVFLILEAPIKLFPQDTTQPSPPTPPPSSGPPVTPQPEVKTPKGIYLMVTKSVRLDEVENILSKPFVDGALIGSEWSTVEPSEGNYDWSIIDQYLEIVKSKGKKATLVVIAGKSIPEWVYAKGVKTWNWVDHKGQSVTYPNPTDPKFYELWIDFVKALGQKYANDSSISQVNICGGTGALCGLRFYELPPDWDPNIIVEQWKKIVDTYVMAFPNTNLFFEVHTTKGQGLQLSEQMMSYNNSKYGNKIGPFEDFLSTTAPQSELASTIKKWGPQTDKGWCAFQQARAQGPDLNTAYSHGYNDIGCKYFEIYKTDLQNPAYDPIHQKWHDLIWGE